MQVSGAMTFTLNRRLTSSFMSLVKRLVKPGNRVFPPVKTMLEHSKVENFEFVVLATRIEHTLVGRLNNAKLLILLLTLAFTIIIAGWCR